MQGLVDDSQTSFRIDIKPFTDCRLRKEVWSESSEVGFQAKVFMADLGDYEYEMNRRNISQELTFCH